VYERRALMVHYRIGVSSLGEDKKEISITKKGVAFHDQLIGEWTRTLFLLESGTSHGLLMKKNISRRAEKPFLFEVLFTDGVKTIELKKKSFIVERETSAPWPPVLKQIIWETRNYLHTKLLFRLS